MNIKNGINMLGKKRGLGKGLDSLLSSSNVSRKKQMSHDIEAEEAQHLSNEVKGELQYINVDNLQVGKYQPRRDMVLDALEELADSIRTQGIIQPLVVRKTGHHKFEIIAGERRWRSAKMVGLESIPCLVKNIEDEAAIVIALIENIQRENLNAMEEAIALKRLLEEFELTHVEVAKAIGKSRTTVSNLLRLNNLTAEVQKSLEQGDIEMGHARALLPLNNEDQIEIAQLIIEKDLTVRETEKIVKNKLSPEKIDKKELVNTKLLEIENSLTTKLETKVSVFQSKTGKGKLVIEFEKDEKLDDLLRILKS